MAPSEQLDYLNFDEIIDVAPPNPVTPNFLVSISLSRKVILQKRTVYDAFTMLGDVGGLWELFHIVLGIVFQFYATQFLLADKV